MDTAMLSAVGDVLPAAVGVALSPVPIIAVILVLGTARATTNGPAFAAGWVAGLTAAATVVLGIFAFVGGADDPDSTTATGIDWLQVGIGVLFLALALRQWRTRPRAGETPEMPAWMTTVDSLTPGRSLGLGVLLSAANPKNLALSAAAAASVAQGGLSTTSSTASVAAFVAIGSLTVVGPVVYVRVAADSATEGLAALTTFLTEHAAVIMMVVLLVLGAKFLGEGVGALGG